MHMQTLPSWVWMVYYSFLFITLVTTVISIIRKKNTFFSIIVAAVTMLVPAVSLINNIGRDGNEFEYWFEQLQEGQMWSIFVTIGYVIIVIWLLTFSFNKQQSSSDKSSE
ncbi:hypothetical protein NQ117_18125 [Paenibacillus sp. SC116]|uniref:hypothetical protein n=1 Tax=Paenibacillus sp. SC116 TaxID=2968986 RepID=UPI00215B6124|nr:hypothetical protein [Paenibacillus sp. SC116]MCR8845604.1 hypothetical protein [Paenibacillus sp. SC116]